jgi:adenine-specific DNA-methyltransferase
VPPASQDYTGYDTQKPVELVSRILEACSRPESIVADLFCGSGTSMVAAEKLGRRWIGCDLGRFAIHTSRKRLLGIEGCKPFEVLNLGRYERRYWQGINAGEALYEYFQFIVNLYHADTIVGFMHLHGRKGEAMVHVGATDAPVTISEVRAAMTECQANGLKALDVLGWEWEMGLNNTGLLKLQQQLGVAARLFHIPHEIMDKRAVAAGDVHFYEAAYIAAKIVTEPGRAVRIELTDFLVAIDDYIREKVGDKVKTWSDWIDYWAVDFEYNGDVFHNQWQTYRTRKEPKLERTSGAHRYASTGKHQILVKVVDIFGNDTTALLEVEP